MATGKESKSDRKLPDYSNNPLAKIAGKFGGKFWQETQSEIKRLRQLDKDTISQSLDIEAKTQD